MKKILLFLILIVLCGCIEKPTIRIKDVRVEGITSGEIKIKVLVDIFNPNSFSITLRSIDYKIYFDSANFGTGNWEGKETLKAESATTIPVSLNADSDIIMRIITSYFQGKLGENFSDFSLEGKVVVEKYGKSFTYNFNWKYGDRDKEKNKHKEKDKNKQIQKPKDEKPKDEKLKEEKSKEDKSKDEKPKEDKPKDEKPLDPEKGKDTQKSP